MRYLVEVYLPDRPDEDLERIDSRARTAADGIAGAGAVIRFVESIFVPEDEMCLLVYEADAPELVRAAAQRAGLACERLLRASTQTRGGKQ